MTTETSSMGIEDMARGLAALFTPEMVRAGWHVGSVFVTVDVPPVWSASLYGPVSIDRREHLFANGSLLPAWTWRIEVGEHGTLSAYSPEALIEEVRGWAAAIQGLPAYDARPLQND